MSDGTERTKTYPASRAWFKRTEKSLAGGVSSRFRMFGGPHPNGEPVAALSILLPIGLLTPAIREQITEALLDIHRQALPPVGVGA